MAITLTIGGTNFKPQYKTNSLIVRETLQNRANSASMQITKKSGQSAPLEGQEVIFKDGSRFLFAGHVSSLRPQETGKGDMIVYDLEATDYTYILINKVAQKTYQNQTLKDIVDDLLTTYVDAGYGFTTTNVETGPVITTIAFDHISLRSAFEKLAKVTGMEWWVDYETDVHFIAKDSTVAPESLTDAVANHYNLSIEVDTSQMRNQVIVKGGREETSTFFSQILVADGEAREWILREKPTEMNYIKVNGVSKTIGVDNIDDESGYDFMFNYQEKYVRCSTATTTPALNDEIEVSYKYEVPIIVPLRSTSSILATRAIEGGDGIHARTITDTSIKSKDEARQRALKELLEYGNPLLNGSFETRTGLLTAGSYFKPGQELTVNLPTWGIATDTKYLIQEVVTTLVEDGVNIEYNYRVRFGGRLLGVRSFLESLAAKEEVVLETQEIDRVELIDELATITEVITKDGNERSVSESMAVSESIVKTRVTPPFFWGPDSAINLVRASSQYIVTNRPSSSPTEITICAWVKPASNTNQMAIVSLGGGQLLQLDSNLIRWWANTGTLEGTSNTFSYSPGDIFFVAATYKNSGNVFKIYKDAVDITATTQAVTLGTSITSTYIGSYQGTQRYFNGVIDGVKIWSKELTAAEILEVYYGGDVQMASLLENYPMMEGTGTTTADKSGNGRVGTLTNSPTWVTGIEEYDRILRWNIGEWS